MISGVEWRVSEAPLAYPQALDVMLARQEAIASGQAGELVWLLEHPPTYTAGTSADPTELIDARFPVFDTGRGGRYTYHGPGQRTGYLMLNLASRRKDVRCFVHALEGWIIDALGEFDVAARRADGRIGIWCDDNDGREAKIGAIGVRIRKWVTAHGFAVNVDPDLNHFSGIVPCGISEYPVTSLAALGKRASMDDLDDALAAHFPAFLQKLAPRAESCETPDEKRPDQNRIAT